MKLRLKKTGSERTKKVVGYWLIRPSNTHESKAMCPVHEKPASVREARRKRTARVRGRAGFGKIQRTKGHSET